VCKQVIYPNCTKGLGICLQELPSTQILNSVTESRGWPVRIHPRSQGLLAARFKSAVSWVVGKGLQALSIWYIVWVQDWAKNFSLSWLQVPANYAQPLANGCQMSS
jgi:hypothetical protein